MLSVLPNDTIVGVLAGNGKIVRGTSASLMEMLNKDVLDMTMIDAGVLDDVGLLLLIGGKEEEE